MAQKVDEPGVREVEGAVVAYLERGGCPKPKTSDGGGEPSTASEQLDEEPSTKRPFSISWQPGERYRPVTNTSGIKASSQSGRPNDFAGPYQPAVGEAAVEVGHVPFALNITPNPHEVCSKRDSSSAP